MVSPPTSSYSFIYSAIYRFVTTSYTHVTTSKNKISGWVNKQVSEPTPNPPPQCPPELTFTKMLMPSKEHAGALAPQTRPTNVHICITMLGSWSLAGLAAADYRCRHFPTHQSGTGTGNRGRSVSFQNPSSPWYRHRHHRQTPNRQT